MRRPQRIPAGLSFAAGRRADHRLLRASEHSTIPLPPELILPGGKLDIHEDVLKCFQVLFKKGAPFIQLGRYVGYIPLNDRFALSVEPRVPIGNMERLMGIVAGYKPMVLSKHLRSFSSAAEAPISLIDLMAEQLLAIFQRIWRDGLVARYERREHVGSFPTGSVRALESALLTQRRARPLAVSSSFERTTDYGPNRMLRLAVEHLTKRFLAVPPELVHPKRLPQLRRTLRALEHVSSASPSEVTPIAVATYLANLPQYHEHYVDALLMAELIIHGQGLSIRDAAGQTVFRTILVNMEDIFEAYVRQLLSARFTGPYGIQVLDGNKRGVGGARTLAYEEVGDGVENSDMTPDIVLRNGDATLLIADAKYKPNKGTPDRNDLNQCLGYSVRHQCQRVMLLYPLRPAGLSSVHYAGKIGDVKVYTGHIDLASGNIEAEESLFCSAILDLIAGPGAAPPAGP